MPLTFKRFFTKEGQTLQDVFDEITPDLRDVVIKDPSGKVIFEQRGVVAPSFWSDQAVKIVAQKYFYGKEGTEERENSVFHLVKRVVDVYGEWAKKDNYLEDEDIEAFKAELGYILINQIAAFNSPVWFNIGNPYTRNQVAACFLVGVDDDMSSILEAAVTKGQIFKWGSGSGTNLSKIRSSKEFISGGGRPSGPLSFLKIYDTVGQTIKSGGRSRRAAMLFCLDIDHPDVQEFIHCKSREEAKGKLLIASKDAVLDGTLPVSEDIKDFVASVEDWDSMDGEAYQTVSFQNMNISVQIPDEFMKAVENDEDWYLVARTNKKAVRKVKARELFREIAQCAWECADPGVQFSTTINNWHTVPEEGPIVTSNPCCFTGNTKVLTANYGFMELRELAELSKKNKELPYILAWDDDLQLFTFQQPFKAWKSGISSKLVGVHFDGVGYFECTPEHKFCLYNGTWKQAKDLTVADKLRAYSEGSPVSFPLRISHIIEFESETNVYDLEMPLFHNFVVFPPIGGQTKVGVTVHNSEYLSVNETACNLASINLTKIGTKLDSQWRKVFEHVVRVMYIAMDLSIDNSDYPTEKIAKGTRKVRNLGLGYTNLGSLLILNNIPYDSDKAREIASYITSLLTVNSYLTSADIADGVNKPFPVFERNKKHVIKVLEQHRNSSNSLCKNLPEENDYLNNKWNQLINRVKTGRGLANSQATVIAPTGCLVPSTMVMTSKGILPLHMVSGKLPKPKEWKELDLEVVQELTNEKATKLFNNGNVAETVKITTLLGYTIEGTPNHMLRTLCNETGEYTWKELQQFDVGDSVFLRRGGYENIKVKNNKIKRINAVPTTLGKNAAITLGMYAAGGTISGNKVTFTLRRTDDTPNVNRYIAEFASNFWGAMPYTKEIKNDKYQYKLVVESKQAVEWVKQFDELNRPFKDREVPKAILTSPVEVLVAFLSGFTEATAVLEDVSQAHYYVYIYPPKKCKKLTAQLHVLFLALGIPMYLETVRLAKEAVPRLRTTNPETLRVFRRKIGFFTPNRAIRLNNLCTASAKQGYTKEFVYNRELINNIIENIKNEADVSTLSKLKVRLFDGKISLSNIWDLVKEFPSLSDTPAAVIAGMGENVLVDRIVKIEYRKSSKLTLDLEVPNRNTYVANGFISHNTISFLMDAETTGIEPLLGLQVYKNLSGGGVLKLITPCVKEALTKICNGNKEEVQELLDYIKEHGHLKGSSLKEEYLPVFDTAFGPEGTDIHYMGHLKMLAAVQPLVSGSISKTCNLPSNVTVEEVEDLYMWAWKKGLKCVAIYRDGCKFAQSITTKDPSKEKNELVITNKQGTNLVRKKLPQDAPAIRHKFSISGHEGVIHTGLFDSGEIAEVFIRMYKDGSTVGGLMDSLAICLSWMAQHGILTKNFLNKLIGTKFDPMGLTTNPEIRFAQSPVDYIARYLSNQLEETKKIDVKVIDVKEEQKTTKPSALIGPPCTKCGAITEPKGSCYTCPNCGEQSGCG